MNHTGEIWENSFIVECALFFHLNVCSSSFSRRKIEPVAASCTRDSALALSAPQWYWVCTKSSAVALSVLLICRGGVSLDPGGGVAAVGCSLSEWLVVRTAFAVG